MSLFSALQTSLSGLQTATQQMQLAANNISNANTPGYSAKQATLGEVNLGSVGGGVEITGYSRASDAILTTSLNNATSDAGKRGAQNTYLQQVQDLLGTSSSSNPPLEDAVAQLSSAWQQLAAQPESNVNQQQVVQTANNLVTQIQQASTQITTLDRQVSTDVNTSLADLNNDLQGISDINLKISNAVAADQPTGDLEDQRDLLVQKVAGLTSVNVMQRAQGQIALYTPGGYMLLDGSAQSFSYDGTNLVSTVSPTQSLNGILTGGSLEAKVAFRATTSPVSADPATSVIQKLRSQMNALATAFTTSSAGPPPSFAYAYANAAGTTGEATSIFTGTDSSTFAVNSALLNGTATIKVASPNDVVATFTDSTKSFSADGLSLTNTSYAGLASGILSGFQQAASNVQTLSTTATSQQTYLQQRLSNENGVNVDTETVSLTTLQNSYAASAHVISIIDTMFTTLFGINMA